VAEINGNLDLSTTQRELEVRDCTGEFTIFTRYADCRLTNLTGNVNLDGRGRVYAENIRGNVRVTNEYSRIELFNVEAKLLHPARTAISGWKEFQTGRHAPEPRCRSAIEGELAIEGYHANVIFPTRFRHADCCYTTLNGKYSRSDRN
jgi:hypothetical protein